MTVRVAVIGLGFMGTKWVRALARHPAATTALVCDIDEARARTAAEEYGCRWSIDPLAAAADAQVDGVVVCTPDHLHEEPALAALGAGHALAVEKPFAHDVAAAERIEEAARAADAAVLAAHILRFEPRYAALRQAIEQGRIGAVQAVRSERIGLTSDQDVLGGRVSIPLYYGTHEMDLARWYAGPIARVTASRSSGVLRSLGYDVDDLYSVQMTFTGGAHGTAMLGWLLPPTTTGLSGFTVIGEDGYLRVEQASTGLVAYDQRGAIPLDTWYDATVHGYPVGALANEVDHFVRVVRQETPPLCGADDGVAAVRAALAIERAATERHTIAVEEKR